MFTETVNYNDGRTERMRITVEACVSIIRSDLSTVLDQTKVKNLKLAATDYLKLFIDREIAKEKSNES